MEVLASYPKGTLLFTSPSPDGKGRQLRGPTRWPVEVRYDPSGSSRCSLITTAGTAEAQLSPSVAAGEHVPGIDHPQGAQFWRVSVRSGDVASRPHADTLCGNLPAESGCAATSLPRLLHVAGRAAGGEATMFLDSGAQLNLIGTSFARKHHLRVETAQLEIDFPDGRGAKLDGLVRNVRIRMGTYEVTLDLHVFDLRGQFDVLLGKGWHDQAQPQISWRHNQVQVFQKGKYHRFGSRQRPMSSEKSPDGSPKVSMISAKAFRRCVRKGDTFVGKFYSTDVGDGTAQSSP